jgi:hypothetical protein
MTYPLKCIEKAFADNRVKFHVIYVEDESDSNMEMIKHACTEILKMHIEMKTDQEYTQVKGETDHGHFIAKIYVEPIMIF